MRILSKFTDYYDFVSKRYGADPNVTYLRSEIKLDRVVWHRGWKDGLLRDRLKTERDGGLRGGYLTFVIAAKWCVPFLCSYASCGPDPMTQLVFPQHDYLFCERMRTVKRRVADRPILPEGAVLEDLIRLVGAPVFVVREWDIAATSENPLLKIDARVPRLADLGFPALVPPEQMWQEVYSTLQNVIRTSPDRTPPVEVGNEYKIHAAGFDLKTSFRHPINVMPKKRDKRNRG